jgi:hypothetical protein
MTGDLIRKRLTLRHGGLRHSGQSIDLGKDGDHWTVACPRARDKGSRNAGHACLDFKAGFPELVLEEC